MVLQVLRATALLLILGSVTLTAQVLDFTVKCCPDGTVLVSPNCEAPDGTSRKLSFTNCSTGMYILDPKEEPEDTFIEVRDTGELNLTTETNVIKAGTWCAARKRSSKTNETHEVALVCFNQDEEKEKTSKTMTYVYGACMLVSCGFLVLTLIVYVALPELRDLQGKCLMANVLSLTLGYLPLALIQFYGDTLPDAVCLIKAFFLYFWLLSSFFWLNVVSFNVWRSVTLQGRAYLQEKRLWYMYCTYAWGVPFLFFATALITHFAPHDWELLRPRFGTTRCWFQGPSETWAYFYGPVAALISINIFFFTCTAISLWRGGTGGGSETRLRSHRFKFLLYLKLFIVMGITWIFEVVSYVVDEMTWFWYMTDILNCLQGVLIFVILVCRKRTIRALVNRRWGAAVCPKYLVMTVGGEDEESDNILAEEVELARPAL